MSKPLIGLEPVTSVTAFTGEQRVPVVCVTGTGEADRAAWIDQFITEPDEHTLLVVATDTSAGSGDRQRTGVPDKNGVIELGARVVRCARIGTLMRFLYGAFMRKVGVARPEIAFGQVVLLIDRNDDPLPLVDLLYSDPQLSLSYRLSAIIDLLDAASTGQGLEIDPMARRRIAIADKVMVTGRDTVAAADMRRVLSVVEDINPFGTQLVAKGGFASFEAVLCQESSWRQLEDAAVDRWNLVSNRIGQDDRNGNGARREDENQADGAIRAIGIEQDGPLEFNSLMRWLMALLVRYGDNLYRIKALCSVAGASFPLMLDSIGHAVGPLAYFETQSWNMRKSRLILAGKGLNHED